MQQVRVWVEETNVQKYITNYTGEVFLGGADDRNELEDGDPQEGEIDSHKQEEAPCSGTSEDNDNERHVADEKTNITERMKKILTMSQMGQSSPINWMNATIRTFLVSFPSLSPLTGKRIPILCRTRNRHSHRQRRHPEFPFSLILVSVWNHGYQIFLTVRWEGRWKTPSSSEAQKTTLLKCSVLYAGLTSAIQNISICSDANLLMPIRSGWKHCGEDKRVAEVSFWLQ